MRFFLIKTTDPFTILKEGEYPDFPTAFNSLYDSTPGHIVVGESDLYYLRGEGAMSSVDETQRSSEGKGG